MAFYALMDGKITDEEMQQIIGGTAVWQGIPGALKYGPKAFARTPKMVVEPEPTPVSTARGAPKPSPKFRTPTNPPSLPPEEIPAGYNLRVMPPTEQYPNGYWVLEKPMTQGGFQKVNPITMKPGPNWDTHVPLPPKITPQ